MPVLVVAGERPVSLPDDFFSSPGARALHARVSAFGSKAVRRLIDLAIAADKGFTYAALTRRDHLATSKAGRPGWAEESRTKFEALEVARTRAREADESVAAQMKLELQGSAFE